MENIKMTKVEKLNQLLAFVEGATYSGEFEFGYDVCEFLNHEMELIEKRNKAKSLNRKPSKTQVENQNYIDLIHTFLTANKGRFFTAKEIAENLGWDLSSQKMTALLKKVVEMGATKVKGKLVSYGIEVQEQE